MSLSPVSPRSPTMLRKTLASVPPPLTLPVQMVTRYFITEKHKRRQVHARAAPYAVGLTGWSSRGSGSPMMAPVAGSSLMISLSSSFTSSQRPHWNEYFSIVKVFSSVTCRESLPLVTHVSRLWELHRVRFICAYLSIKFESTLTFAKCQPEKGFLFSCQIRSFSSFPTSGISIYIRSPEMEDRTSGG